MQDYSILPSDLETNPAILVILQPSQKMNHWPTCHVPRDIAVLSATRHKIAEFMHKKEKNIMKL